MTQPIVVFVRLRPTPRVSPDIILDPNRTQMIVRNSVLPGASSLDFTFNHIFQNASQEEIFEAVGKPAVDNSLEGYNSTIFAYGQTSAGKSFSSIGDHSFTYKNRGLLPRILDYMFQQINARHGSTFELQFSALEIYNERLIDLLTTDATKPLAISDTDGANGQTILVKNLTLHTATSYDTALELVFGAESVRSIAESSLNMQSSRAHCIYTIHLRQRSRVDESAPVLATKLNVVDLAGSERASASISVDATGNFINKSLTFLEQVVNCLNQNAAHVPYRTSKLTHILRDSIGGNCKTYLLACIRPEPEFLLDTISTLRFAQRASYIKNTSSVNLLSRYYDSVPAQASNTIMSSRDLNSIIATAVSEALSAKSADPKNNSNLGPVLSKILRELEQENKNLKAENLLLSSGAQKMCETDEGKNKIRTMIDDWIIGRAKLSGDITCRDDYIYALSYLKEKVGAGGGAKVASGLGNLGVSNASNHSLGEAQASEDSKAHGQLNDPTVLSIGEVDASMIANTLKGLNSWKGAGTQQPVQTPVPLPPSSLSTNDTQVANVVEDIGLSTEDTDTATDKRFQEFISNGIGFDLSRKVVDAKRAITDKKATITGLYQELERLRKDLITSQTEIRNLATELQMASQTSNRAEMSNVLSYQETAAHREKQRLLDEKAGTFRSLQVSFQIKKEEYDNELTLLQQLQLAETVARQKLLLTYESMSAEMGTASLERSGNERRSGTVGAAIPASDNAAAIFTGAMKRAGLTKRR
ncbi:Kinesin-9 [Giardia muris]|uniref:Kinesin-9 n=1 Tax=Giardia muris TaxID=5742 RepID=A0A4Z1T9Z2_GIAMU|nr:Kinesin-9 [Giardia muris]|eukprot:TNJ30037.1 Kinesin-9 [Giardia muris]